MPFFSIIIPVHNVAAYLGHCVDSILSQHCPDIEIILVDDYSSDGSGAICDRYTQAYDFIHTIHFERNRGVVAARNQGVFLAKGDYIVFIDSDDCLFSGSLEGVRKLVEKEREVDLTLCRYISENGVLSNNALFDPTVIGTTDPEVLLGHITRISYHLDHCWHYVFNRNFIRRNELQFMDVIIAEDGEYITQVLTRATRIAFYEGNFYWYRERDGSLKNTNGIAQTAAFFKIAAAMYRSAENDDISKVRQEFLLSQTRHALGVFAARLAMHTVDDIREFSSMITRDELLSTGCLLPGVNLAALVTADGDVPGALAAYKETIAAATLALVAETEARRIYIYCTGPIGEAVMKTLLDHGCAIEGVIDDNASLSGRTLLGKKISTASFFTTMTKDNLSTALVIVCNQKKYVFDKIASILMGLGVRRERIVQRMF